jgi:DNA polymerase III epsilon subunit-like protein
MLANTPVLNNVMIDLETMGIRADSVVLSIGAVYFGGGKLGDTFYAVLDTTDQQERGRRIEQEVLQWWAKQSENAKAVIHATQTPTDQVLDDFAEFLGNSNLQVWGNGASFDNIILYSLYQDFDRKPPWNFTNDRCYRTLKNIAISPTGLPARKGTHHNALDDAIHQAECAMLFLKGQLK